MTKIIIMIIIAFIAHNAFAFLGPESTPRTLIHEPYPSSEQAIFLDAAEIADPSLSHELIDADDAVPGLEEYDRHVTDTATAPKMSTVEMALQKVVGALIVNYISLRESARIHFQNVKNVIARWYHSIIR